MSCLQVSVFSGRPLGDYFPNQVAKTKILVAMAPKVVAAWGVGLALLFIYILAIHGLRYILIFVHQRSDLTV